MYQADLEIFLAAKMRDSKKGDFTHCCSYDLFSVSHSNSRIEKKRDFLSDLSGCLFRCDFSPIQASCKRNIKS